MSRRHPPFPRPIIVVLLLLGALAAAAPTAAFAQEPAEADTAARRRAMEALDFLVGDWEGEAWAMLGPGERLEMRQTERVRRMLGGQVLLVQGLGRRLADGAPADTAFEAIGVIDWLPDRGYALRSWTMQGDQGTFPLEVSDDGYTWGFDVPQGKVRYTMGITEEGAWREVGEFSPDGGQHWLPVFEMTLERKEGGAPR